MSASQLRTESVHAMLSELAFKAEAILHRAEAGKRGLSSSESQLVETYLAEMEDIKKRHKEREDLDSLIRQLTGPGTGSSLLGQWKSAGFVANAVASSIPFWGAKTAVFDDGSPPSRLEPVRGSGVGLGFDSRFIFQVVPAVAVDQTTTSVDFVRQTGRSLATSDSMIRNIDSDGTKPETTTNAALLSLNLRQVATVSTSVPNILVQNQQFKSFIDNDLRLAYERALDWMIANTLAAAALSLSSASTLVSGVLAAAETMLSDGFNPSHIIVNPAIWRSHVTARATDSYINRTPGNDPLAGFTWVVTNSYYASDALVLDPESVGKLYVSPVSLSSHEENFGQTNSSTVRMESHAGFAVERSDAAVEVDVTA